MLAEIFIISKSGVILLFNAVARCSEGKSAKQSYSVGKITNFIIT
jgi:hypothetical protein